MKGPLRTLDTGQEGAVPAGDASGEAGPAPAVADGYGGLVLDVDMGRPCRGRSRWRVMAAGITAGGKRFCAPPSTHSAIFIVIV